MATIKTDAITIRSVKWSDSSLILTFLSKDFGKIKAIARSALKPNNKFSGQVDLLQHVSLIVDQKPERELNYLKELDIKENHFVISERYDAYYTAMVMAEVTDKFLWQAEGADEMYLILSSVLRQFHTARHPEAFLIKYLIDLHDIFGYTMALDAFSKSAYADLPRLLTCVKAIMEHEYERLDRISVNAELKRELLTFLINHLSLVTEHQVTIQSLQFVF
jgi:DNA repair protein RecO